MSKIKSWLGAVAVVLMFAGVAGAQYRPWPSPIPSEPAWGDYDTGHTWRDAGWWWQNQPAWVREHHPEWWGDFDDEHAWHPAWWWRRNDAGWVRDHHPEWWGDEYEGDWYPAPWWYQYQPDWARAHHPEWWAISTITHGIRRHGGIGAIKQGLRRAIPIGGALLTRAVGIPRRGGG